MDKETADKVVQIFERIKALETINEQIKLATLSFVGCNCYDAIILSERKK